MTIRVFEGGTTTGYEPKIMFLKQTLLCCLMVQAFASFKQRSYDRGRPLSEVDDLLNIDEVFSLTVDLHDELLRCDRALASEKLLPWVFSKVDFTFDDGWNDECFYIIETVIQKGSWIHHCHDPDPKSTNSSANSLYKNLRRDIAWYFRNGTESRKMTMRDLLWFDVWLNSLRLIDCDSFSAHQDLEIINTYVADKDIMSQVVLYMPGEKIGGSGFGSARWKAQNGITAVIISKQQANESSNYNNQNKLTMGNPLHRGERQATYAQIASASGRGGMFGQVRQGGRPPAGHGTSSSTRMSPHAQQSVLRSPHTL